MQIFIQNSGLPSSNVFSIIFLLLSYFVANERIFFQSHCLVTEVSSFISLFQCWKKCREVQKQFLLVLLYLSSVRNFET